MSARRRVVFNADDLGMDADATEGILRAARAGLVKEVSVTVTRGVPTSAIAELTGLGVGIGLHIAFTDGEALTGRVRGLTDGQGRFRGLPQVLLASLTGLTNPRQIERELKAQFELLRSHTPVSHVNGHHHVHVFPGVREAVLALAERQPTLHVRALRPSGGAERDGSPRGMLLGALGRQFEQRARRVGIAVVPLAGLALTGRNRFAELFWRETTALAPGDHEWLVHPRQGSAAPLGPRAFGARSAGLEELQVLEDPKSAGRLADLGIEVCRFEDLSAASVS